MKNVVPLLGRNPRKVQTRASSHLVAGLGWAFGYQDTLPTFSSLLSVPIVVVFLDSSALKGSFVHSLSPLFL